MAAKRISRAGNCYDNAMLESLRATLQEEIVHRQHVRTDYEARAAILQWIEVSYQQIRIHRTLGYVSPDVFEATERVGRDLYHRPRLVYRSALLSAT
jgi:putative transposase